MHTVGQIPHSVRQFARIDGVIAEPLGIVVPAAEPAVIQHK